MGKAITVFHVSVEDPQASVIFPGADRAPKFAGCL
jgi:hypothetical protein